MIGLLLVDDEPIVRNGIRTSIRWEDDGITIVGEAGNGREALRKAASLRPDIVLCDIRMPVQDGLSFAIELKQILPEVRIIMLTGHADPDYMLFSIRAGINDYLLKPAGTEQIRSSVLRVRDEIETERLQKQISQRRSDWLSSQMGSLRQHFLLSLLLGEISVTQALETAQTLDLNLSGPYYAVAMASAVPNEENRLLQCLADVLMPFMPLIAKLHEKGIFVALLNLNEPLNAMKGIEGNQALCRLSQALSYHLDCMTGAMAISDSVQSLKLMSSAYQQAQNVYDRVFWYPHKHILLEADVSMEKNESENLQGLDCRLIEAINSGMPHVIEEKASELFDGYSATKPPFSSFERHITQMAQTAHMLLGVKEEVSPPIQKGIMELRSWFISTCANIGNVSKRFGNGQIGRALRYMESHFDQELTLESLANALFISPTYLSRLLSEKTAMGFYSWLQYFRIQKAKELLDSTDMKHYEIAEKVGYHSYKVFSENFLALTGMTARQYRDQMNRDSIL